MQGGRLLSRAAAFLLGSLIVSGRLAVAARGACAQTDWLSVGAGDLSLSGAIGHRGVNVSAAAGGACLRCCRRRTKAGRSSSRLHRWGKKGDEEEEGEETKRSPLRGGGKTRPKGRSSIGAEERRAGERKKNHSCTGPYAAIYRLHCIAVRRGRATLPEVKDRPSRKVRVRIG